MATTKKKPAFEVDPYAAVEALRAALSDRKLVLPSLGVDQPSPNLKLVQLGRVTPDVAMRLADALREGRTET